MYLGPKKVVVLAGYKTVKQALVNNAEEFGEREVFKIASEASQGHGKYEAIKCYGVHVHSIKHCFMVFKTKSYI